MESKKQTSAEVQKVIDRMKALAGQSETESQWEPIEDDDLDSIAGGRYDAALHQDHQDFGNGMEKYFGVDTCSFCGIKQQTTFYQATINGILYVMCDTCMDVAILQKQQQNNTSTTNENGSVTEE